MSMNELIADPPPGCQAIPGYIVELFDCSRWLRRDGTVTMVWSERGVWESPEAAGEAMRKSIVPGESHLQHRTL